MAQFAQNGTVRLEILTLDKFRMDLTCRLDMTNLNRVQTILLRHTKRSPARCVNSTAYHVIKDVVEADGGFPVVSQSTIDSDMNVISSPGVLKSGQLSTAKGRRNEVITFQNRMPDAEDASAVNTAMRIVLARMHPNSKFSIETGNRWGIPASSIPSFGRGSGRSGMDSSTLFWAWVKRIAEKMVRARHSSTGFLKKSWIDLKVSILPFALGRGVSSAPVLTEYSEVKPAQEGGALAVCQVSNTLGVGLRTTRELSEKYNQANHRIAGPRLQNAIDREFDKKMKVAAAKEWANDEPELRALGMVVNP